MKAWWYDLSQRERLLIMAAGALAGILFVSLLMVRPLAQWRADAGDRAAAARDGYELVASAAAVGSPDAGAAPRANVPLRQSITSSAVEAQIELVRIGAVSNGQIEVQPQPVEGERMFRWLGALENQYGVKVVFADISRAEGGAVNAQVLVLERN